MENCDIISELELILSWMTQDDISFIYGPYTGLGFWIDYEKEMNVIFTDHCGAEEGLEYMKKIQENNDSVAFLMDLEGNFILDLLMYQYEDGDEETEKLMDYVAFNCGLSNICQIQKFVEQDYCVISQLSDGAKLDLPQLIKEVEGDDEV